MDIVLPVPDYHPEGSDVVEMTLPRWVLNIVDREREPMGQSREDYLFDLIVDGLND